MNVTSARLHDQSVAVEYPDSLRQEIAALRLFRPAPPPNAARMRRIVIEEDPSSRYALVSPFSAPVSNLKKTDIVIHLLEEVVRSLVFELDSAVALHAGAVSWHKKAVLVAGPTHAGKTSLIAWLASNGFEYLSDELVVLTSDKQIEALGRPLIVKAGSRDRVLDLPLGKTSPSIDAGANKVIMAPQESHDAEPVLSCGLIIFVQHSQDADLRIEPLSPAQAALRLMGSNLNADNLLAHGLPRLKKFSFEVPAISLSYGDFDQLTGVADHLIQMILTENWTVSGTQSYLSAFGARSVSETPRQSVSSGDDNAAKTHPIPAPTPKRPARKLTIGMATYDDYDGVYFTIQALRLYHPEIVDEIEFLVIDNHPDGACGEALKNLENWIPNYRYIPTIGRTGTAIRDVIFEEASGDYVLCIDCHVLIFAGSIRRLLAFYADNPESVDLLHGPMVYDDLRKTTTHFEPGWRAGMYGRWAESGDQFDADAEPFEIPMQGLGLFSCRKAVWPGFNPAFKGFGGEEGYIHEKFRQAGGRTLCLPFLRWVHRFARPMGIPYPNIWEDRIRNYLIGFRELGLSTSELEAHFKEHLGEDVATRILTQAKHELSRPEE
jgi:hypothetical protein